MQVFPLFYAKIRFFDKEKILVYEFFGLIAPPASRFFSFGFVPGLHRYLHHIPQRDTGLFGCCLCRFIFRIDFRHIAKPAYFHHHIAIGALPRYDCAVPSQTAFWFHTAPRWLWYPKTADGPSPFPAPGGTKTVNCQAGRPFFMYRGKNAASNATVLQQMLPAQRQFFPGGVVNMAGHFHHFIGVSDSPIWGSISMARRMLAWAKSFFPAPTTDFLHRKGAGLFVPGQGRQNPRRRWASPFRRGLR